MAKGWVVGVAVVVIAAAAGVGYMQMSPGPEPQSAGSPTTFRRLNEGQYTRSISDVFGEGIKIPGRFEPQLRDDGLLAIGDAKMVVTPTGIEQYELRAREIAAQVMTEERRKQLQICEIAQPEAFNDMCAKQVAEKYGRLLFRRPLTEKEVAAFVTAAKEGTEKGGNFYKGLETGISRLLMSPHFIFRAEASEPDPAGGQRLTGYSLATRLSFLVWDSPPDAELLDAAAKGDLHTEQGLQREITRMLASPKFEQGVRSFFTDMYAYDQFEGLSKDQSLYPKFTSQLAKDAKEQSLRTIVDHLVTNKGDYRDLFTTKKTFVNRNLGSVYKVPVDEGAIEGWVPYTFGPKDPRAGILTLAGFLMLDPTHEGKSSPTIRGKFIREQYLCQMVPLPPGDVDFTNFQDPKNPNATVRERLTAHRSNPTCAGCHKITDPIGLSIENYDAIGEYRTHEKGSLINATDEYEGKTYTGAVELQKVMRDDPALSSCVAQRVYEYSIGRKVGAEERPWLDYVTARFAREGHTMTSLIQAIATSKAFTSVSTNTVAASN